MKRRFSLEPEAAVNGLRWINITNLVDVALTMVVVLLMVSPYIEQGFGVQLPASSSNKMMVEKNLIVTVSSQRRYYIGNQEVSLKQLKDRLEEKSLKNPDIGIIIKADRTIRYQDLIVALDAAKAAKITRVGLATEAAIEE
ncbi:MAG: biopolymer transporter ExbD [Candidatus Ratteibacteria bacterium]|jgi:biopolymer transport protein ExbD